MPLSQKDKASFEEIDKLVKKRAEIHARFMASDYSSPWISSDEAHDIYSVRMKHVGLPSKEDRKFDDAYRRASAYHKTRFLDLNHPEHQESLDTWITFLRTGNLKPSGDYQIDLSIVKQCYEDTDFLNLDPKIWGILGDVASGVASASTRRAAQLFSFFWSLGGSKAKEGVEKFSYKDYTEIAKKYIDKHGKNEPAITEFIQQFDISDQNILKALLENSLKNQGVSDKKIEMLIDKIIPKLQEKLENQAKDASITKVKIQAEITAELSEDITESSRTMVDIQQQVSILSDQLTEHMTTVNIIKYSILDFEYAANEIKGLSECAHFLSGIAAFTHSTELAMAAKFTQGVAEIAGALNKLKHLKSLSVMLTKDLMKAGLPPVGPLALAGGYAAVGFAAFNLISSFIDQGPSSDQIMLEFLNKLAKFIVDEFKKVHEKLDIIHKDMVKGFDLTLKISQQIFELQTNTLYAVQHVSRQIHDLKNLLTLELKQIGAEISVLTDLVQSGLETINEASFTTTLRQLNDLLDVNHNVNSEQVTSQVQSRMNTLVGDHILGKSPIAYYTGAFYFDSDIFNNLAMNSKTVFFSPSVEIDDNDFIFDSSKKNKDRLTQAMRINTILDNHKLTSLIGFFAQYAQALLSDKYKSSTILTAEQTQLAHSVQKTNKDINKKKKKIKNLEKKELSDTEKKQLTQDKVNLEKLEALIQLQIARQEQLTQLNKVAIKSEKASQEKLEEIDNKIKELRQQHATLQEDISQEQTQLKSITDDIEQLCPGLTFLYHSYVPLEYAVYQILYQNFYKEHLSEICDKNTMIYSKHHANDIKVRLGFITDDQGNMAFNYSEQEDEKIKLQIIESVYEKIAYHMIRLFSHTKKVEALTTSLKLLQQEIVKLEVSKELDAIDTRKPLSERLVFNSKLWILAVHKYLEVVQHPMLGTFYTDYGLQHAQKLIIMAQNQMQFVRVLRENPELFKILWTNYATTLVHIHRYYHKGWKTHFKNLNLPNSTFLESEIIANPLLVLDQEGHYAVETLKNSKFGELLIILEAQKKLLVAFYQLVRPNSRVMWLLNSLWDTDNIQMQLKRLAQKERQNAPFTTYEVYHYLNQAYVDIATYQTQDYPPAADIIQFEAISSLTTHLQRRVQAVQANSQLTFYTAASQVSQASQASLQLVANNDPDDE